MEEPTFDSDLIHSIMKRIWTLRTLERENVATSDALDSEVGAGSSKKNRTTSGIYVIILLTFLFGGANASALKLTCELLRVFVTEAVQRAVAIAETEGDGQIEATHLESILPQLLLDF
ncbi:protein MHF2 homolog isoform X1 [Vicia villosa]|uniref:protein MHF2 homolog isoform X1 n=1 Tax=Vicia villosa TaxID=3911 RepID=UPI00273BB572|nr:protein MHF2 homolog isoform X1 [Vicia villosa]